MGYLFSTKSFVERFVSCRPETNGLILLFSLLLLPESKHTHTTPHVEIRTKHRHHGPPNPLAPDGSNFTGECDRCTLRDRSRSSQSSDVTFIDETKSFILLTIIILCAAAHRARGQKVSFWSDGSCFFCHRCIKTARTDPSYSPIPFLPRPPESSSCFGIISDELGVPPPWYHIERYDRGRLRVVIFTCSMYK